VSVWLMSLNHPSAYRPGGSPASTVGAVLVWDNREKTGLSSDESSQPVNFEYLSPGVYDITCPELQVAFQLEFLFAPENT